MKISEFFLYENLPLMEVKFSIYLNRRVFLMEGVCYIIVAFPRYSHIYTVNPRYNICSQDNAILMIFFFFFFFFFFCKQSLIGRMICKKGLFYSNITKTRLYNFDPLKPHFYIVKLGFTGVYIFFLTLLKHR